ncbi:helix-turn-helix domain-containing protein [Gordonia hankookensis]|uniref:Helix-turn-helix transcriptional regulator n=1 Tax=Gordonia hankookensis TaxID=589403 RepID=A0ABR7W816_9ACTN|nr:AraC family transcriptional regulator [Gordonia hankookensis]MBD1318965.1 helix-turn-helix transcriptional regulator [Gordonia hankookensis]
MFTPREDENRRLLRARDAIDRAFAEPLDVATLARIALISPAHFTRRFRDVFGETPHRYLQRRRIERACALLRNTELPVTGVACAVGYTSLGTFGRTFSAIIGRSPTEYRRTAEPAPVPSCFVKDWTRPRQDSNRPDPSSFGEAGPRPIVVSSGA